MLNRLLYYLIINPFSKLPMWVLYGFSDLLFVLIVTIIPYRKKIALENLSNCFPELGDREKKKLLRKNYHHITNILAESIKNLSISQKGLQKRYILENPEIFNELDKSGKSVIVVSSHYSNWEFLITAQNLIIPQLAIGIGKPLSRKFLNKKINALRERNGMVVVNAGNYKDEISARQSMGTNVAILALADQAPSPKNAYWTSFFNIQTPFPFGPEFMAHQYNFPVVFLKTSKVKRGYYKSVAEIISLEPDKEKFGSIMDNYVKKLEDQIREKPEHWLWTHKRWKHSIPDNIDELKIEQKATFYRKFPGTRKP